MLAPTPLLKPSPLDVGGLFSGTFEALKRRFGLLVLIALFPSIALFVVMAAVTAFAIPVLVAASYGGSRSIFGGLATVMLLAFVGLIVVVLLQVKSYGMFAVTAYEVAQGQRPGFGGVWSRTKGFLPAMAGVIAIVVGAMLALYLLMTFLIVGAIGAGTSSRGGSAAAGLLGLFVLLVLAMIPLAIFFGTKLLYTIPAVAIEGLGGVAGMKRSWTLTRGSFWRTFGYYLLASLAVSFVSYLVGMVSQVLVLPFAAGSRYSDPSEVGTFFAAMIPALLVSFALQVLVQLVSVPFVQTYITYMFIDQVRRSELPPAPAYGYGAPYYTPPEQYYGQAAPGSPQQGSPQQGYPQQGYPQAPGQPQGWGGPSQQYPPPRQGQWPPSGQYPPQGGPQQPPQG